MIHCDDTEGRAARAQLSWLADDALPAMIDFARPFVDREEVFIPCVLTALSCIPGGGEVPDQEATVRALLYLARQGNPRGLPSTD